MKYIEHADKLCPISQSLGIIGDSWSLLIIRNCFMGTHRFDEFQQQLGLTRHVLADRLKKLVKEGVLDKVPQKIHAKRFEYKLSPKGKALSPVFMALGNWGNQWLTEDEQQPMYYHHKLCGQIMKPQMCCSECGELLESRDVKMQLSEHTIEQTENFSNAEIIEKFGFKPSHFK